jgi:hypothetical protein
VNQKEDANPARKRMRLSTCRPRETFSRTTPILPARLRTTELKINKTLLKIIGSSVKKKVIMFY